MDGLLVFLANSSNLDNRTIIGNAIRSFFGLLSKFTYRFFAGAIDLMYDLARFDYGMNDYVNSIGSRIFGLLIIFMIFKLSFSLLSYIVNADSAMDSNKGFPGLIKRIVISLVLLVSINPIFSTLKNVQAAIFDDDLITSIFALSDDNKVIKVRDYNLVGIRMNPHCPPNKMIYTITNGDRLALFLFRPFLQPYDMDDIIKSSDGQKAWDAVFDAGESYDMSHYCGYDISGMDSIVLDSDSKSTVENIKKQIPGPNGADGLLKDYYYNLGLNEAETGYFANGDGTSSQYFFDFNYFFALLAGVLGLLIVISFCFDVVIRSLTLILLQMVAPIPIISYISPQGKSSDMLSIWAKQIATTWISLFIRIIALTLGVTLIDRMCSFFNSTELSNASLIMQLFIVLGTLMFMKKLPQLIEQLFPGLKLDSLKLNPFKRVSEDALGGKAVLGAGAALGAAGLSAGANAITGVGRAFNRNTWRDKNGRLTAGSVLRGLGNTVGSPFAGAASAGRRAFMKTSKDGRIFNGLTQGHLEAQFAKQQREDLARKGSTLGGRIVADANRWIGRENAAQRMNREILEDENALKAQKSELMNEKNNINEEKIRLQNRRDNATKDYTKLQAGFKALNERMDNSGIVDKYDADGNKIGEVKIKDEIEKLEWMKTSDFSNEVEARKAQVDKKYESRMKMAIDAAQLASIKAQMDREKSLITSESIKQEKLKAQNDYVNELRSDYVNQVVADRGKDEVATQILDNINEIKANNADIAGNTAFALTIDGKYNKGAVYKAADKITTISNSFNNEEQALNDRLYNINVEEQNIIASERAIAERKESEEYVRAMADNAAQSVKSPQPENWLSSADIAPSSGYGGYQLHSRSGGPGPGPGPGPGGPH